MYFYLKFLNYIFEAFQLFLHQRCCFFHKETSELSTKMQSIDQNINKKTNMKQMGKNISQRSSSKTQKTARKNIDWEHSKMNQQSAAISRD